jgi:hypothetical protein
MLVAWVLYPLVLLALCAGLGLLVDALTGRRLPGALVPVVGLAAIVVVGQITTLADATAELTTPLLILLAGAGLAFSLPWRRGPVDPLPAAVALGVFLAFGAPVILSGEPTFAGFVRLDDTATWLALTDRVMEHGRDLGGLAPSTYQLTLDFNLADGYPIGVFLPFGAARELTGGDLAWVFQPYVAFLAAMLSLCIWEIARAWSLAWSLYPLIRGSNDQSASKLRAPRSNWAPHPGLRALVVFVAAQPALLVGYALWGGVKEMGAAVFVALAAALAPAVVREGRARAPGSASAAREGPARAPGSASAAREGPARAPGSASAAREEARDIVTLGLAAAALVGVLSMGGLVWLAPMLLVLAALAIRALGPRAALARAAAFALLLAVFTLPILLDGVFSPLQSGLTNESELGNLAGPLNPLQALGIWPTGDFRVDPEATVAAAVLIALAAAAAALGLWAAWRARSTATLLYATALLACAAIVVVGSPWVGGKALATAAPVALALAMVGGAAALSLDRLSGIVLLAAVAAGVLWSNALAYRDVSLAPYAQLRELEEIGEEFAGEGPALMTEYNPFGARHFLRELDAEGASELRTRLVPTRDGGQVEKGFAADTDELDENALLEYRTLVLRASPVRSRPPLPYRLLWAGDYYEVWQRPVAPTLTILSHQPYGGPLGAAAVPDCGEVVGLGLLGLSSQLGAAPQGISLAAAPHAPVLAVRDGRLRVARPGEYTAWLEGSVHGSVEVYLDGEPAVSTRNQINNEGGFIRLGRVRIGRGNYAVELRFGGADLRPGSGGRPATTGPVLFSPTAAREARIVAVPPDRASELCGRRWDWIEAIAIP